MITQSQSELTAIILAGGKSTRFGVDKARHLIDHRPMVEHVAEIVGALTEHVVLSVGAQDRDYGISVPHVVDHFTNAGPLAGVHAGLVAAETAWVLVVATDMPFLTTDTLGVLCARRNADVQAVIARTPDGQRHPLCACYHQNTRSLVEAHLASRRLAMHAFIDQLKKVEYVDLPAGPLRNVNRLSDL